MGNEQLARATDAFKAIVNFEMQLSGMSLEPRDERRGAFARYARQRACVSRTARKTVNRKVPLPYGAAAKSLTVRVNPVQAHDPRPIMKRSIAPASTSATGVPMYCAQTYWSVTTWRNSTSSCGEGSGQFRRIHPILVDSKLARNGAGRRMAIDAPARSHGVAALRTKLASGPRLPDQRIRRENAPRITCGIDRRNADVFPTGCRRRILAAGMRIRRRAAG